MNFTEVSTGKSGKSKKQENLQRNQPKETEKEKTRFDMKRYYVSKIVT